VFKKSSFTKKLIKILKGLNMKVHARHILIQNATKAKKLKQELGRGADFTTLAKLNSKCQSGKSGGDLGWFAPGEMVAAFDKIVFKEKLHVVHGPIKSEYGFHLIEIMDRI